MKSSFSAPQSLMPREKSHVFGIESLSDEELIALFLGHGSSRMSVFRIASSLLGKLGGIEGVLSASRKELMSQQGLGEAQTSRVLAASEMMRRFLRVEVFQKPVLNKTQAVKDYLRFAIGGERREHFQVLFLNKRLMLQGVETLFLGTIDRMIVYPRDIIEKVLAHRATHVILAHNHPSGNLEASREDRDLTENLARILGNIHVRLMDHMIVTCGGCFSFREEGLL